MVAILAGVFFAAVAFVYFSSTQSHWHAGPREIGSVVCARFYGTVVSDLAPYASCYA